MIRKATIAYLIFFITILYILTPWFFEKKLLFNELLAVTGLFILAYKRSEERRVGKECRL